MILINELKLCFRALNNLPLTRESTGTTLMSAEFNYLEMKEKPVEIQNTKLSLIIIKTAL